MIDQETSSLMIADAVAKLADRLPSKREWLAGLAMQAILANNDGDPCIEEAAEVVGVPKDAYHAAHHWKLYVAKKAVQQADALLEQLAQHPQPSPKE